MTTAQKVWRIPPFDIESMVDPVEGLQTLAEAFISGMLLLEFLSFSQICPAKKNGHLKNVSRKMIVSPG
jgi:hypothetical protein